MLISLNWLKQYVDIKIPTDELVTLIGARLVEVEGVIDQTHKYDNVYIVEVVTAEKIPDTHLTLCRINDSGIAKDVPRDSDGLIQVMCGAPNVRVGMLTAWISPGAVVPASFASDAPFLIGTRKMLKKYESHGMLAGADVLVDQLYSFSPSMNSLEAMARGTVVIGGGEEEYYDFIGERKLRPIVNVSPERSFEQNVKAIEDALVPEGGVARLSRQSMEFVRKHHDSLVVARQYAGVYCEVIET